MTTTTGADELREEVRRRYAESARAVGEGSSGSCGGGSCCAEADSDAARAMMGRARVIVVPRRDHLATTRSLVRHAETPPRPHALTRRDT